MGLLRVTVCWRVVTRALSLAVWRRAVAAVFMRPTLNSARAALTRAAASFLASEMSLTVLAKRLSWRAFLALRAASIREEAALSIMSAWWRSLAMRARTLRNWAAVDAAMARILLFAKLRKALSWAAAWAASLERPFLACSLTLAILWSKRAMDFSRSLRAFLAFSRIWAALAAMCELVCLILALVADARAARARCWLSTAIFRLRAAARLFLRMISRVLRERRMVRSRAALARRALTAILARSCFFMEARAAWL